MAGCAVAAGPDEPLPEGPIPENPNPEPPANLLADSTFELPAYDSGTIQNFSLEHAPWGGQSWGVQAAVFNDGTNHALGWVHAAVFENTGYVFAHEDRGKLGFIRFVQGDMFGGGFFGPIPWKQFTPVAMEPGKHVMMSFDVFLIDHKPIGEGSHWLLQGLNVWVSGPGLPAGSDKTGHKPIVMDLVVENDCSDPGCGLKSFSDDAGFHYQNVIARPAKGQWTNVIVDLTAKLDAAFDEFGLPESARAGVSIYQAEYVVELSRMEAASMVDNVALWVE